MGAGAPNSPAHTWNSGRLQLEGLGRTPGPGGHQGVFGPAWVPPSAVPGTWLSPFTSTVCPECVRTQLGSHKVLLESSGFAQENELKAGRRPIGELSGWGLGVVSQGKHSLHVTGRGTKCFQWGLSGPHGSIPDPLTQSGQNHSVAVPVNKGRSPPHSLSLPLQCGRQSRAAEPVKLRPRGSVESDPSSSSLLPSNAPRG